MGYIKVNSKKYIVVSVKGQTIYKDNLPRESVTFILDASRYNFDEVSTVFSTLPDEFHIYNDNDELQGIHKGYIYLDKIEMKISRVNEKESKTFEVTVYSTTDTEQKLIEHENILRTLQKINDNLGKQLVEEKLIRFKNEEALIAIEKQLLEKKIQGGN